MSVPDDSLDGPGMDLDFAVPQLLLWVLLHPVVPFLAHPPCAPWGSNAQAYTAVPFLPSMGAALVS